MTAKNGGQRRGRKAMQSALRDSENLSANLMHPSAALLAKLGSVVVHAEEAVSAEGHAFDVEAIKALVNDREVKAWIKGMGALLPQQRKQWGQRHAD